MNKYYPPLWLLTATSAFNAMSAIAEPQSTQPPFLEEVIVTAGFRENSLLDSTASVTVVGMDEISQRGADHLEEILNLAPNVSFSSGGSRARFLQMRGVGDLEQFVDPKHFPSVGITVDDISLSGSANAALLMDTAQIEILRGPQGTRFGTNALAGMVNITTNTPSEDLEGYIEGGLGNYHSSSIGGAISGPLSESLLARVAVQKQLGDGYIKNHYLDQDDTNNIDESAIRGKLRWLINDTDQIDFTANYFTADNGYDAYSLENTRHTTSDEPGHDKLDFFAASANGLWQLNDGFSLNIIGSWNKSESDYGYDEDWSNPTICNGYNDCYSFSNSDRIQRDQNSFDMDTRLLYSTDMTAAGDYQSVVGVYAQQRKDDVSRDYYGRFTSRYETDRLAAYGQIDYMLNEQWHVIIGARAEHFNDDYHDSNQFNADSSDNLYSGEITLQYFTETDHLLYATISRGEKPGGVNIEASSVNNLLDAFYQPFLTQRLTFDSESLTNYELGFKGRFIDSRLMASVSVFYMQRDNAQLENWLQAYSPEGVFYWVGVLDSVDKAENYGAEVELNFIVSDQITVFAAVGYLHTNVDEIEAYSLSDSAFVEVKDRDQTKAPHYQYNIGAELRFSDDLTGRIEVEGRDEQYFGYYHDYRLDSYNLVNASLRYIIGDIELGLWGRNLTDETYAVHGLYFANDPRIGYTPEKYQQFGEPRTYGMTARYDF